jgi:hypothetical protein
MTPARTWIERGRDWWPSLALAAVAGLASELFACWPQLVRLFGLRMHDCAFLDLHALLAAGEAYVGGLDPYLPNPLDFYHRPHVYSSWWLVMGEWGLVRADAVWLGTLLVSAFIVAAACVVRPRSWREVMWGAAVILSPAVSLGVIRANNDLVVFVLMAPLPWLLAREGLAARLASVALIGFAAGLKYYPAVAGILLLHALDGRRVLWTFALTAVLAALLALGLYEDFLHFSHLVPRAEGLFSFGMALGLSELGWSPAVGAVVLGAVGLAGLWRGLRCVPAGGGPNTDVDELRFVLGAVLLVACFGTAMNWSYRWVFALWLLPWLLRGENGLMAGEGIRRIGRWLLVLVLWWDGVASVFFNFGPGRSLGLSPERYGMWTWALIQPLHWVFFCGLAFIVAVWFGRSVVAARATLFRD